MANGQKRNRSMCAIPCMTLHLHRMSDDHITYWQWHRRICTFIALHHRRKCCSTSPLPHSHTDDCLQCFVVSIKRHFCVIFLQGYNGRYITSWHTDYVSIFGPQLHRLEGIVEFNGHHFIVIGRWWLCSYVENELFEALEMCSNSETRRFAIATRFIGKCRHFNTKYNIGHHQILQTRQFKPSERSAIALAHGQPGGSTIQINSKFL